MVNILWHYDIKSNVQILFVMFATSHKLSFVIINTVSHKNNIMKKHWILNKSI